MPDWSKLASAQTAWQRATSPGGIWRAEISATSLWARGGYTSQGTAATAAIQEALDGYSTVFIPAGRYIVSAAGPCAAALQVKSNTKIVLDPAAIIQLEANSFEESCIFDLRGAANVEISGGTLMGDRYAHLGTTGEWGMGINLIDAKNISIKDTIIRDCWGDGIYIGSDSTVGYCESISIDNVLLDSNRRQGISVISVKGLHIKDSQANNTSGTNPQSGIDFEPNYPGQFLQGILLENFTTANNGGYGIECWLGAYAGSVNPVSLHITGHADAGSTKGTYNNIVRYMDAGYGITVDYTPPEVTCYNLIANGAFSNMDYWQPISGTMAVENNTLSITAVADRSSAGVYQKRGQSIPEGTTLFYKFKICLTNSDCDLVYGEIRDGDYWGTRLPIYPDAGYPSQDIWETLSDKLTVPEGGVALVSTIRFNYPDNETALGKTALIKEVMMVDLTPFGENTPSVGECEVFFRDFDSLERTERTIPETITNLITNPTFDSTDSWQAVGGALSVSDNILSITGDGSIAVTVVFQQTSSDYIAGTSLYMRYKCRVTNANCDVIKTQLRDTDWYGAGLSPYPDEGSPAQDYWYTSSATSIVGESGINNVCLAIRGEYADAATANGMTMQIENVLVVDLTDFGETIPGVDECDVLFRDW